MKIICHRGNTKGPRPDKENTPEVIDYCISEGYDVEIDLWYTDDKLYLGHDYGQYLIDWKFLQERKDHLWIHAKNFEALAILNGYYLNHFWHETDYYTLTSKGFIWTYPSTIQGIEIPTTHQQIILDFHQDVDFEYYRNKKVAGVCVDHV